MGVKLTVIVRRARGARVNSVTPPTSVKGLPGASRLTDRSWVWLALPRVNVRVRLFPRRRVPNWRRVAETEAFPLHGLEPGSGPIASPRNPEVAVPATVRL